MHPNPVYRRMPDEDVLAFARGRGFGLLLVNGPQGPLAAHVPFTLTPDGKVSQTLLGLEFPAKDLRLALVEASAGEIGNALDRALLFCFHYDATEGRYAVAAMNLMRLGGGVTVAVLGLWLFTVWRRDRRRRRVLAEGTHS